MKRWLYAGLILGLVPLQTTLLKYVSVAGIRPDLCLIATCLVGFVAGEAEGVLLGLALGFMQDLVSSGEAWLNMLTKGTIGLLAGIAGRHLARTTSSAVFVVVLTVSALASLAFLLVGWSGLSAADAVLAIRSILLPQALFDATVAAAIFWLFSTRRDGDGRLPHGVIHFDG
jgi:rod shape-determining protein MreD